MKAADLIAKVRTVTEASSRSKNPPEPKAGSRLSYLITFDYGVGSTDGMLQTLWNAGHYAITGSRYPRTSIVCRTAASVPESVIRDLIAGSLESNGSAFVVPIGAEGICIWPDQPWKTGEPKKWKKIVA